MKVFEKQFTKDTDRFLCLLYKEYLKRKSDGKTKSEAKSFGSASAMKANFGLNDPVDDVADMCRELSRNDFMTCAYADNTVYKCWLDDNAIVYMENRFKKGLSEVADFVSKFIP